MAERLPKKFGPYVLLEVLGRGAAGIVYLARPADPRRAIPTPVVVKTMHDELADVDELVARFRHEAQLAVMVSSPNVAKVYDAGMVGTTLYIAMEYVPGVRLSQVLVDLQRKGRLLPIRDTVRIFLGGLRGLEALQEAKDAAGRALEIVHRDLSPKNLMLDRGGEMRLIDLGLGKSTMQDWKTRTGTVMGSPGYMAPEQVRGQPAGRESDTYSMGVVLWELLTATPYIPRGGLSEILLASASPEYRPPSSVRRTIPAALDEVLETSLRAERSARFSTARAFRDALEALLPRLPGPDDTTVPLAAVAGLERDPEEIRRLLSLELPRVPSRPDEDKTVVFAEHSEVRPIPEGDLAPTQVFRMSPGFEAERTAGSSDSILPSIGPGLDREETVTQPGETPPRPRITEPPPAPTGTWGGPTEPGSRPRPHPRAPKPRGVPVLITGALVVSAGVLGAVGGRIMLPSEPVQVSGTSAPRILATHAPTVEESPTPSLAGTSSASAPVAPPEAAKKPVKKPKRPRPERPSGPAEPAVEVLSAPPASPQGPAPSAENVEELARALTRRAQSLKQARPDRSAEIDLILGDIALETASGDRDRARRRLRDLGRRLDAMAN